MIDRQARDGAWSPDEDPVVDARRFGLLGVVMAGAGLGVALTSLMPWAETSNGSLSGFSWGPGKATLVCGLLLVAYGVQVAVPTRARLAFGWAVAGVVGAVLVVCFSYVVVDTVVHPKLGITIGAVGAGSGLVLCFLFAFVAVWPLVVLWKDDRRRTVLEAYRQAYSTDRGA
jgi:hypothetical protein